MPSYTTTQRAAIGQFVGFTQSKESIASKFLKAHSWNVEQAVDAKRRIKDVSAPAVGPTSRTKRTNVSGPAPEDNIKMRTVIQGEAALDSPFQSCPALVPETSGSFSMGPKDPIDSAGVSNNTTTPAELSLNKIFDGYRDDPKTYPDKIGIEGAQRYLTDLSVALDEVALLALCHLLQCPSLGEFDRAAFVEGWKSTLQPCDTISRQASHVNTMRKKLSTDPAYFKQVYRNAFKLAKPETTKSVPMENAIEFWRMFYSSGKGGVKWDTSKTAWLELWLEFYETKFKRPVNKDLWNMLGELVSKTKEPGGEDLTWWSEEGAWPMAIDEFVQSVAEKRKDLEDEVDGMDVS